MTMFQAIRATAVLINFICLGVLLLYMICVRSPHSKWFVPLVIGLHITTFTQLFINLLCVVFYM